MSALGDALGTKGRDYLANCKVSFTVDQDSLTADTPLYTVTLDAPSFSETVLEGQTDAEVADVVAEFTTFVTTKW